jgi:hypothetical protein
VGLIPNSTGTDRDLAGAVDEVDPDGDDAGAERNNGGFGLALTCADARELKAKKIDVYCLPDVER